MIIKKIEVKDTPLSNIDLKKWCDFLCIPIKGIFGRNEQKPMSIPRSLSTWMILEVWELIGCVVGIPKIEHRNISTHLGFHHL